MVNLKSMMNVALKVVCAKYCALSFTVKRLLSHAHPCFYFCPLDLNLIVGVLSNRFALVCVGSEASSRKLMELLPKRELHSQNPIVTPCNKQSLSQFEMQSRKSKEGKSKYFFIPVSIMKKLLYSG